ncbi:hypothetical protein CAEBREN_30279 [Caenorhabditis brenneri]|uniref:G-protein coupled receptors family 1 profile domain-containing protein n=1 Tax=Caenorhabditis brenneri TaxID=135651 RepID=G0M964_CAEBE|nr:hypothetical protein CAEBREN_30279 [Caenorhabditis brenneri]
MFCLPIQLLDFLKNDFVLNELYIECAMPKFEIPYYVLFTEFFTANDYMVLNLQSFIDAIISKKANIRRQKMMSSSATRTSKNTSKLVLYLTLTFFVAEFPLGIAMLIYPIFPPMDDFGPHAFEGTLKFILLATTGTHMIICVFMSLQYRETTLLVLRFGYPWKFIPCILFPVSTYILIREIQKANIRRQKMMSSSASRTSKNTSKLVLYLTLTFFVAEFPLGILFLVMPSFTVTDEYGPKAIYLTIEQIFMFLLSATTATHMIICVFMSSQYRETTLLVARFGYPWKVRMRTCKVSKDK